MDGAISSSYSPWIFMGAGLFSFITAWMGSRKPSQIASMVSPIEALRFSEANASRKNSRKTFHGSQVFKMAVGNVFRNTKGTVLVVVSLFLGISLFIIVRRYCDWGEGADRYRRYDSCPVTEDSWHGGNILYNQTLGTVVYGYRKCSWKICCWFLQYRYSSAGSCPSIRWWKQIPDLCIWDRREGL